MVRMTSSRDPILVLDAAWHIRRATGADRRLLVSDLDCRHARDHVVGSFGTLVAPRLDTFTRRHPEFLDVELGRFAVVVEAMDVEHEHRLLSDRIEDVLYAWRCVANAAGAHVRGTLAQDHSRTGLHDVIRLLLVHVDVGFAGRMWGRTVLHFVQLQTRRADVA
jgi:hypothetical protein